VISLTVQDGFDSEESLLLVLDLDHELTIWSIKPWKVDSADVPYISILTSLTCSLDYLIRIQTAGRKVDQSFTPIAKWWPRYANCLAVCTGLAVRIYVLVDAQFGQRMDISTGKEAAISIPIDTGVRDFCFSSDGSALAVVDYHGDILLWALRSDPTFNEFYLNSHLKTKLTLSKPTITYVLPVDLNPCSIQFLDLGDEISNTPFTPLLLVGSSYNRRLHLVDIGQGMVLQEIVLPSIGSENMPAQNFSMAYTKEKRFLTLGDTLSNSIFFFHLSSLPAKGDSSTSQSEYLDNIVDRKIVDKYPNETFAAFDYITELPFFPHHQLQTLAVTTSMDAFLDVFTAHSNGFTMLSPNVEDILPVNYLDAKLTPVKAIPNPELEKAVEPVCSPSPRSLSRRSSVESVRSVRAKSPPVVKKEHREDLREAVRSEDHTQLERDRRTSHSPEIVSKDVPSSAKVSEKSRSPSPHVRLPPEQTTHEAVSSTRDLELFLSQALEQQCTSYGT
jgi:WD40 repeat protein